MGDVIEMKNKKCKECGNPENRHVVFCKHADADEFAHFLYNEMRISLQKLWENERDFKEITEHYVNSPAFAHLPEFDRKQHAAKSAERKLAGANCEYYMKRATMFATALNGLSTFAY